MDEDTVSESAKPDENALAYTGVSLLGNEAKGEPPEWHELQAWRAGTVGAERAAQILSYVANHPDYFQQWLDLVEAEQWAADEAIATDEAQHTAHAPPSNPTSNDEPAKPGYPDRQGSPLDRALETLTQWARTLYQQPVYGGALTALLLAVLVVPVMLQTEQASLQQQMDRSLDTYIENTALLPGTVPPARNSRNLGGLFDELSITDVERQSFQFGLYTAANAFTSPATASWQAWLAELPDGPVDCNSALDSAHCQMAISDHALLGQWAFLTYAVCQNANLQTNNSTDAELNLAQMANLYKQLIASDAMQSSRLFAEQRPSPENVSPEALCDVANQLLLRGQ